MKINPSFFSFYSTPFIHQVLRNHRLKLKIPLKICFKKNNKRFFTQMHKQIVQSEEVKNILRNKTPITILHSTARTTRSSQLFELKSGRKNRFGNRI